MLAGLAWLEARARGVGGRSAWGWRAGWLEAGRVGGWGAARVGRRGWRRTWVVGRAWVVGRRGWWGAARVPGAARARVAGWGLQVGRALGGGSGGALAVLEGSAVLGYDYVVQFLD